MATLQKIAVLRGDGIGPEVVAQSLKVVEAINHKFGHSITIEEGLIGAIAIDQTGSPLPQETIDICKSSDAVILGAIGDPKYDNDPSATVRPEQGLLAIRKELGLFCNIRPISLYDELIDLSPIKPEYLQGVNFIIFRELTGGIYFGKKEKKDDYASDLCEYHSYEIERIAKLAFEAALKRKKKVTLIDKANVLESSRLWRKVVMQMSKSYPTVTLDYLFIDNATMQVILNPRQFDVVLCSNMFGDIISDESSVLAGSLGLLPSGSIGEVSKLYEPVHGSYPQAAGLDIANPIASILSTAMMFRDFDMDKEADCIENAVKTCISKGIMTQDLHPTNNCPCSHFGDLVESVIMDGADSIKPRIADEHYSIII